jgi:hypothetical protein
MLGVAISSAVLRIGDVNHGSWIQIFPSRIPDILVFFRTLFLHLPNDMSHDLVLDFTYSRISILALTNYHYRFTVRTNVADPNPDPRVFGPPGSDPDPLVRGMDPDPSIIKQN